MKILKAIILIIISFLAGVWAISLYASSVRQITVPEYINGYSTIELLEYLSTLKAKEDAKQLPSKTVPLKSTPTKGGIMSAEILLEYEN